MRLFQGDPLKLAAPRPARSRNLMRFVAEHWGLHDDAPRDLGGSFNLNLLVSGVVVRVYGPWESEERVTEMQRIRRAVAGRGFPLPGLRPSREGAFLHRHDGCLVEVEEYLPGRAMASDEQLLSGMRMLGALHTAMSDLAVTVAPVMANHLPQELAALVTGEAATAVRAWDPTAEERRYAELSEQLASLLPIFELPAQAVHGDFWDNNVLFVGREVTAILDFDFADRRPRVDDLALPLSYLAQGGTALGRLRELVDAYDSGNAEPLSGAERRALPFAMARTALSFLQYLLLRGDAAYEANTRREFRQTRGPVCAWWLVTLRSGLLSAASFL